MKPEQSGLKSPVIGAERESDKNHAERGIAEQKRSGDHRNRHEREVENQPAPIRPHALHAVIRKNRNL